MTTDHRGRGSAGAWALAFVILGWVGWGLVNFLLVTRPKQGIVIFVNPWAYLMLLSFGVWIFFTLAALVGGVAAHKHDPAERLGAVAAILALLSCISMIVALSA